MVAVITDKGFEPVDIEDLQQESATKAKSYYGQNFPTNPESVYGVQNGIISASILDVIQLLQQAVDNQNRSYAEGVYLDYLAHIIGLRRLPASGSTGAVLFKGTNQTLIPSGTVVEDGELRKVTTNTSATLDRNNCYSSEVIVKDVLPSAEYSIYVEGTKFSYTSATTTTPEEITQGLVAAIGTQVLYTATYNAENVSVIITYNTYDNLLSTSNSSNLQLKSVGTLINSSAVEEGPSEFPAETITTLVSSILGVESVTNLIPFVLGRFVEQDYELRARMAAREQSTGTATIPAIQASLSNLSGVTSVIIVENDTYQFDIENRPPKSYEVYVSGGNDDEIALELYNTKPAGIQLWGTINKTITDQNGDPQGVKFSRKNNLYTWIRVTYSINSEETFPVNGEDLMTESLIGYGDLMSAGEDLEPTKLYAPLYSVKGMYVALVEIATTTNEGDTPSYQTTRIPVTTFQQLVFDESRISYIVV